MEAPPPLAHDRQPAAAPAGAVPAAGGGGLRFAVTIGAWFVGLFGLMRLGWVEKQPADPVRAAPAAGGRAAHGREVGHALRRRELQRRRPHGPVHGGHLRVPGRVGLAAARGRGGAGRHHRDQRGAAGLAVDGGREPDPARRAAPLRVAGHPDRRRRRLRLPVDGPPGEPPRRPGRSPPPMGRPRPARPAARAAPPSPARSRPAPSARCPCSAG